MVQLGRFLPLKFRLNPDPGKLIMDKIGETIMENGDIWAAAEKTAWQIRKNTFVPALAFQQLINNANKLWDKRYYKSNWYFWKLRNFIERNY